MKYLILESIALKPHLETSGEIALELKSKGHDVFYSWVGDNLPWSDWNLPYYFKLFLCSLNNRVSAFTCFMKKEVSVLDGVILTSDKKNKIIDWASNFSGDLDQLKSYMYEGKSLGMGVASSLISMYGDSRYCAEKRTKEVRKALVSSALVYERAKIIISQISPDFVVTFNGRFATSRPIVIAAEGMGIPVLRHERGATFDKYQIYTDAVHNYEYIKNRIINYWFLSDTQTRELSGHAFFQRKRQGDGIGWYSFTNKQKCGRIPLKPPNSRRFVYFSSSDDEYAAVTDVYRPGPWSNQLEALKALVRVCMKASDIELVIRVHPHLAKKSKQEQKLWIDLVGKTKKVHYIGPNEPVDSYALLDSADVVVTYGSTIGIEAAYWGKPSVLLGPCSYRDTSAVVCPKTESELMLYTLSNQLKSPPQDFCIQYGNYYLTHGIPFEYYEPKSLSDGVFLGNRFGWDPEFIYSLRNLRIFKKFWIWFRELRFLR